jgi:hypothetical protein
MIKLNPQRILQRETPATVRREKAAIRLSRMTR